MSTSTCTHHTDSERTPCPVCLVTKLNSELEHWQEIAKTASAEREHNANVAQALTAERAELRAEVARLRAGIEVCLRTNAHLADGENCTLMDLKHCLRDSRVERAEAELAAERARLRKIALDACKSAQIKPILWYPTGYNIDPNDFGRINEQQVEACFAAIDAAMKEA